LLDFFKNILKNIRSQNRCRQCSETIRNQYFAYVGTVRPLVSLLRKPAAGGKFSGFAMGFPFDFLKKPLLKTRLCDEKMNLQIQNTQKKSPAARYIF